MYFRVFTAFFLVLALWAAGALAQGASFVYSPEVIHPGKAERITLSFDADTQAALEITDLQGGVLYTLRSGSFARGTVNVTFNGYIGLGAPLAQGEYWLRLTAGESVATRSFRIGEDAPQITNAYLLSDQAEIGETLAVNMTATMPGSVSLLLIAPSGAAIPLDAIEAQGGDNRLHVETAGLTEGGTYTLSLTLTADGLSSNSSQLRVTLTPPVTPTPRPPPKPQPTLRPSELAETTIPGDYWSMEIGNYDWQAIWQVMISPMTVVKGSGKQAEKQTYRLRAAPDSSTDNGNVIGLITCETQGIHVLETREDGWSYVEIYNSSYGEQYRTSGKGAGYGNTDDRLRGYVETSRLGTFTPRTEYGLLIDKKIQELYVLTENGLLTTLLISTGKPSASQPWNETPSGEYYLSSKVGNFPSGNLTCRFGMRFNNGDILHEVPYIYNEKYDIPDYGSTEKALGQKASHGCVRVQRKLNADGINMEWIYTNVPTRTKLLIWDDDGRPDPFMDYPIDPAAALYYNPQGGKYYHADPNCYSVNSRYLPLTGLTYAQLDEAEFRSLKPCTHCKPPEMRMSDVDAINAANGY